MSASFKIISHWVCLGLIILGLSGCDNGKDGDDTVPMPYHEEITVYVEKLTQEAGAQRLITVRWVENPDVTDRIIELDEQHSAKFKAFDPLEVGQGFKLRMSILNQSDGSTIVTYDVLERIK